MGVKACAALFCAAALALATTAVTAPPADAQVQKQSVSKKKRVSSGPRARIRVAPRSFLDAGTEVLPGERKFTEYAFPQGYSPMGHIGNVGGRVGWDRTPMPQGPWDVPGLNQW
jgi:hypothetical protein